MSLPGSGSDSEYEPSQSQDLVEGMETKARPIRASRSGARRTSALFEPGGALDSQTTESQWASSYLGGEPPPADTGGLVDVSVQTDPEPSDHTQCCECCEEAQEDLQGVRDDLARTEALYAAALAHMDAVRQAVADEPVVLDPTEQSQKVMDRRPLYTYRAPSPDLASRDASPNPASRDPTPDAQFPEPSLDARFRKPSPDARRRTLVKNQPRPSHASARVPCDSCGAAASSSKSRTPSGGIGSLAPAPSRAPRSEAAQAAPAMTPATTSKYKQRLPLLSKRPSGPAHGEVIVVSSSEDDEPVKRTPSQRKRPRL